LGKTTNHAGLGQTCFGPTQPKKKEKKRKKDICWAKIDPTILGRDRPNPTFLGLTQLGGPT